MIIIMICPCFGNIGGERTDTKRTINRYEIAGELALTGELRPIRGALAMAYHMVHTHVKQNNGAQAKRTFILPQLSAQEANLVKDAIIYPANSLLEVSAHLSGHTTLNQFESSLQIQNIEYPDFNEMKGRNQAKRALEIVAAVAIA
jgi:magnesium chelatase family protein